MNGHKNTEALFKELANRYIDTYGESLQKEMEGLETRMVPRMDAAVKEKTARVKRARYTRIFGLVAACLVVLVMAPAIYSQVNKQPPVAYQTEKAVSDEAVVAESAGEAAMPATEEELEAPAAADAATDGMAEEAEPVAEEPAAALEQAEDSIGDYELIPLNATLPENFSISAVDQDKAKTIYYIDDTKLDDAVITMERDVVMPDVSGYREITINGEPAYGSYGPDYSILIFEKDGVLYELTCKHDLNTLLELGEAIL